MALVLVGQVAWPLAVALASAGAPHVREWGHHALELAASVASATALQLPPVGELAGNLPTAHTFEHMATHWRSWLAASLLLLLVVLVVVASCSCCLGILVGATLNSTALQALRTGALRHLLCQPAHHATNIQLHSDPPHSTNQPLPIHCTQHQLSQRLAWPTHIRIKHPETWNQFEYAERVHAYISVMGQPGRIHVSQEVNCPVAEVERWEQEWSAQLARLGDLASGPRPSGRHSSHTHSH